MSKGFLALVVAVTLTQRDVVRDFESDAPGAPPPGFTLAAGRDARSDGWRVVRDGTGRALAHAGDGGAAGGFAVAVLDAASYEDVEVSVRLKATGGARTAGLVWKYRDPLNHYALQLDLGGQAVEIYRVVRGNRIRVERDDDLELDPGAWHTLRVRQHDDEVRVYLGGIRVFRDRDRSFRGGGRVGLWASGDTTVAFDDFAVDADARHRGNPHGADGPSDLRLR